MPAKLILACKDDSFIFLKVTITLIYFCFQNAVSMISIESVSCQSVNQSEQLDKADNLRSIEHCPG